MSNISHVIFELNGTLLDIDVISDLLTDYAKNNNKQMSIDIKSYVREMDSLKDIFYKYFDSINLVEEWDRSKALNVLLRLILYKGLKLSPGADRLVKHLYSNDIQMALVSSGSKREFDFFGQKFDNYFNKYFTHSVCALDDSEVLYNKTSPDLYTRCAEKFPRPPESMQNVLVIEDSVRGITGAIASGAQTLLVNNNIQSSFDKIDDKITANVNSFNDLIPEAIGLPAYGCWSTRL